MRAVMAFSQRLVVLVAGHKIADGEPQDVIRNPRWWGPTLAASLTIAGIDAGYGAVRVLEDVSLTRRRRRDRGAARHQRQRQEHADEMHHGHRAAERRHASSPRSTAHGTTWSASPPRQIVDLGIALVPEGRRLFPRLTVEENLLLGAFRQKARADDQAQPRVLLRGVPAAGRAPQPARRLA